MKRKRRSQEKKERKESTEKVMKEPEEIGTKQEKRIAASVFC